MQFDGFDWDDGNWPKCGKHGVTQEEIETLFLAEDTRTFPDPAHSGAEVQEFAIGLSCRTGHAMAVIFTRRQVDDLLLLRPVSARYMHDKEVGKYERTRQ